MARDRDLLTDREFFRKTADIAEHVRNCGIDIVYWNDDNKVIDKHMDGTKFILNVATPAVKGIEKFTAFNHELGHIIMDSPIPEAKELVDKWMNEFEEDENSKIKRDLYWNIMNILEDQRIESLMAKLWLANSKRFIKARTNRGKMHKTCNNNPVNIILNIRFFRDDLAKEHEYYEEYKQALEDVHGLGRMGALILLKKLKPIIDKWCDTPVIPDEGFKKDEHITEPLDGNDVYQMSENPEMIKDDTDDIDSLENDNDFDKAIDESKKKGDEEIDELKSSLSITDSINPSKPSYLREVLRRDESYNINKPLSHNLRKVFRNISEMPKSVTGYDGDEIDMDAYIDGKVKGSDINKCFIDKKIVNGLSVVISIDGSASMKMHSKMNDTRDLVATLFDSVRDYNNIKVKANVWSSNGKGEVGITEINNINDCKNISLETSGRYCLTPTHLALDYSSRVLKTMKGKKKLLILITDGQPQYQNYGYSIAAKTLLKMNKKAALRARRHAHEMVVISVGLDRWGGVILDDVFGKKKVVHVRNMDDGANVVVNRFKNAVLDTLK